MNDTLFCALGIARKTLEGRQEDCNCADCAETVPGRDFLPYREAIFEHECKLAVHSWPIAGIPRPFFRGCLECQVDQLGGGLITGDVTTDSNGAANCRVQGLYGIGSVNQPADLEGKIEKGDDRAPDLPLEGGNETGLGYPPSGGMAANVFGINLKVIGLTGFAANFEAGPCGRNCQTRAAHE